MGKKKKRNNSLKEKYNRTGKSYSKLSLWHQYDEYIFTYDDSNLHPVPVSLNKRANWEIMDQDSMSEVWEPADKEKRKQYRAGQRSKARKERIERNRQWKKQSASCKNNTHVKQHDSRNSTKYANSEDEKMQNNAPTYSEKSRVIINEFENEKNGYLPRHEAENGGFSLFNSRRSIPEAYLHQDEINQQFKPLQVYEIWKNTNTTKPFNRRVIEYGSVESKEAKKMRMNNEIYGNPHFGKRIPSKTRDIRMPAVPVPPSKPSPPILPQFTTSKHFLFNLI